MKNFIEIKVTCTNQQGEKVTAKYLVSAISFSDAEVKTVDERATFIVGALSVKSVKWYNISALVTTEDAEADYYFKVKVQYITVDERTGKDKRTNAYLLVQASSIEDAMRRFNNYMNDCITAYEVKSIAFYDIAYIIF